MSSVQTYARTIIPLGELTTEDRTLVGTKAANLGELMRAGLSVPDGFVLLAATDEEVLAAARGLGNGPFAARSSGVGEDLAEASFAGQYETLLGVTVGADLIGAIKRVRASAHNARVQHYREGRATTATDEIAVLVQRMLAPQAAGVAFTANPVTGDPGEVVITAGRGLGERIVSGEAVGDEWAVGSSGPRCQRSVENAITADQALEIASLARRVEAHFGVPQDIEWAIEKGQLYLLQARPMTAVPEPVDWTPPAPGYWMRNLRLGEWLSDPITPLFADWLLGRIESGFLVGMRETAGAAVPFQFAAINGWYYTSAPSPKSIPRTLVRALVESRGRVLGVLLNALVRVNSQPEVADRMLLRSLAENWREQVLPGYRRQVAEAEGEVESASPDRLLEIVDGVAGTAGRYLWSLAIVGGSAWKMEGCLARFLRQSVPQAAGSVQVLLRGLPGAAPDGIPAHAVQSVDWYWPTAGEMGWTREQRDLTDRHQRVSAERQAAEAVCRQALANRPILLRRFETLLEVAQRYAVIREQQAHDFTLAWPLLRQSALRLGEALHARNAIDQPVDVFFLKRDELAALQTLQTVVAQRRGEWERQRRLVAPLTIGKSPRLMQKLLTGTVDAVRTTRASTSTESISGQPASPGRATGPVHIVNGPEDFDSFLEGEVLVARATAPAWTPLFGRAAAVVTDGGTLAAHASLVAREYGIPAVVGTGDATRRLRNGQLVTVDGSSGVVELTQA